MGGKYIEVDVFLLINCYFCQVKEFTVAKALQGMVHQACEGIDKDLFKKTPCGFVTSYLCNICQRNGDS